MKSTVLPVIGQSIPNIILKAENVQDEANFNAVMYRNGGAVAPDGGFCVVAFEMNGSSFQSITLGPNDGGIPAGSSVQALNLFGGGTATYQNDALKGKVILLVFIEAQIYYPDSYTLDNVTGTIIFNDVIDDGARIRILYT